MSNTDLQFPSDFVKLGSEILYLFLAEKWSFVILFVCLLPYDVGPARVFLGEAEKTPCGLGPASRVNLFVATCPILAYFLLKHSSS